jgi:hypothetical protein
MTATVPVSMCWDTHILFQCTSVNLRFSLTTVKESARNGFLLLTDMHHICCLHGTLRFR